MESKAARVSGQLRAALESVNARTFQALRPSRATVSTMTITARLNVARVSRQDLLLAIHLAGDVAGELAVHRKKASRKRARPDDAPGAEPQFFNQVTLRHGTKSVKVFSNGSMHVTGCTSAEEFCRIAGTVCGFMQDVAGIDPDGPDARLRILGFDVQMININFSAGATLHLARLREECRARNLAASYDADVYPGLNVKLRLPCARVVTALLFRSGKVIMTGARTGEEVCVAHGALAAALDAHLAKKIS